MCPMKATDDPPLPPSALQEWVTALGVWPRYTQYVQPEHAQKIIVGKDSLLKANLTAH